MLRVTTTMQKHKHVAQNIFYFVTLKRNTITDEHTYEYIHKPIIFKTKIVPPLFSPNTEYNHNGNEKKWWEILPQFVSTSISKTDCSFYNMHFILWIKILVILYCICSTKFRLIICSWMCTRGQEDGVVDVDVGATLEINRCTNKVHHHTEWWVLRFLRFLVKT